MLKRNTLLLCLVLVISQQVCAQSIRGAEMYTTQISGFTYKLVVDVYVRTTGTASSTGILIEWGDGIQDTIDMSSFSLLPSFNLSVAHFEGIHTYSAVGYYTPTISMANWDNGLINMNDSENQPFTASLQLILAPFMGGNHFNGYDHNITSGTVTGDDYIFNLSYSEPDGDSVVIEQQAVSKLAVPSGYQYPTSLGGTESISGNVYHFDNIVGLGPYAVSFITKEFRSGALIASQVREFVFEYPAGLAGMDELNSNNPVNLYPNPGSSSVYIATSIPENFGLYDLNGQPLLTGTTNQQVNISTLAAGIYFVRTSGGMTQKLVKE